MILTAGFFLMFLLPFLEGPEKGIGFAVLLISAALVGYRLINRKIIFDATEYLFALFLLFSSISTIFSWSAARSFAQWLVYLSYFIIFLSLRRLNKKENEKVKLIFLYGVIAVGIILSLVSLTYFLPFRVFPVPRSGMNLYFPTFGHNHLSGLLLIAIPLSLALFINSETDRNKNKERLWGLITIIFLVSLVLTFSRSGYVLILFCMAVFMVLKKFDMQKRWLYLFTGAGISVFFASQLIFLNSLFGHGLAGLPKQLYKPVSSPDLRLDYIFQAWEGFKSSPIFGTGLDTFRYVSARYQTKSYTSSDFTHNHFLELFTETGINGGFIFAALIAFIFIKIIKERKFQSDSFLLGLSMAVFMSAVNNLIDYDWQLLSLFLFFFICVALLFPIENPADKDNPDNRNFVLFPILAFLTLLSASLIMGRVMLFFSQKDGGYHPAVWSAAGSLVSWQSSFQESLAQLSAANKEYSLVALYNDRAQRLDKYEMPFYTFRAYLEDGLGNYDSALENHLMAIWTNPLDTKGSYKSIYRYMITNVIYSIKKHQLIQAYNSLISIINIFPSVSRQASLSSDLEPILSYLNKGDDKSASEKLHEIAQKGLDSVPWIDMNDPDIKYAYDKLFPVIDNNR